MIVLWILVSLLAFLFVLTLFSVSISFSFEEEVHLVIRYLFFRFSILPAKHKEKKPLPKQEGSHAPQSPKKKEKKNLFKDILQEKGLKGFLKILQEAAKLLGGSLRRLARHIRLKTFSLEIAVSTEDAAETAIQYGKVCSAVYPAASVVVSSTACSQYTVDIRPDFDSGSSRIRAGAELKVRVLFLLITSISLFFKGIAFMKRHELASLIAGQPEKNTCEDRVKSAGS